MQTRMRRMTMTAMISDKFKASAKPMDVQNRLKSIKAKLHAQNALLTEVKEALEAANRQLNKPGKKLRTRSNQTLPRQPAALNAATKQKPNLYPSSPRKQYWRKTR